MFQFLKKTEDTAATPEELIKRVKSLEERLAKTRKELDGVKQTLALSLTKVAVVRFNPFKEIGGNQSFSVALLNDENDGLIITSHFGRDSNRVYAKQVKQGKPEFQLSHEEEEVLKQAKANGQTVKKNEKN